jgi:hypothetical protein
MVSAGSPNRLRLIVQYVYKERCGRGHYLIIVLSMTGTPLVRSRIFSLEELLNRLRAVGIPVDKRQWSAHRGQHTRIILAETLALDHRQLAVLGSKSPICSKTGEDSGALRLPRSKAG